MLLSKQAVKRYFIFAPHLTSASALPGETHKHENRMFSLKCCNYCFSKVQPIAARFL